MKLTTNRAVIGASAILLLLSLASFFGQYSQLFELCSHFIFFYAIFQSAILVASLVRKIKIAFPLAAIGLALNIPKLTPMYDHFDLPVPADVERVRIISFNCEGKNNHNYETISQIAKEEKADIVCFSEINDAWVENIKVKFKDYPFQNLFPNYGGIGMVSKLPFADTQVRLSTFRNRPRMLSTIILKNGRRLSLLTVRPTIPLNKEAFDGRNLDFELYAKDLATIKSSKVLIGDLNCTPWSYYYSKLCAEAGLVGCNSGKGPANTWSPGGMLLPLLPIDQCLTSDDLATTEMKVERAAGSDHRPILVEIMKNPYDYRQTEEAK